MSGRELPRAELLRLASTSLGDLVSRADVTRLVARVTREDGQPVTTVADVCAFNSAI